MLASIQTKAMPMRSMDLLVVVIACFLVPPNAIADRA
jgi:hypothetical protein